jgi:hypothetical protein
MNRILYLFGTSAGGWAGWWLGSTTGFMTGFMLGVVGTAAGIWATRRFIAAYMP